MKPVAWHCHGGKKPYRHKHGIIPDEWFENDPGPPVKLSPAVRERDDQLVERVHREAEALRNKENASPLIV